MKAHTKYSVTSQLCYNVMEMLLDSTQSKRKNGLTMHGVFPSTMKKNNFKLNIDNLSINQLNLLSLKAHHM